MERLYRVVFDTQRNRRYITWGIFVIASNQKEAKEKAFLLWNGSDCNVKYSAPMPHMFHTDAARMTEEDRDHDIGRFYKIEDRFAFWGY